MEKICPFEALDLIPHPLTIVTAGDPNNPSKRGGMTVAWVSRVSWDPPLVAIAVAPTRYTYKLIKEFKAFVIHIISKKLKDIALEVFGTLSGKSIDKFDKAEIKPLKAENVIAPIIPSAIIVLECKFVTEYTAGDHVIIIGEVINSYKGSEENPLIWFKSNSYEIKI